MGDAMKGDALQKARENAGLSRAKLAEILGVHRTTVFRWEEERVDMPKHSQVFCSLYFNGSTTLAGTITAILE